MDVPTGTSTWSDAWSNRAQFALWRSTSGTALQEKQGLSLKPLNRTENSWFYLVGCCSSLLCQQDFLIHRLLDARMCRDQSCRVEGWAAGLSPPAGRVPAAVFVIVKTLKSIVTTENKLENVEFIPLRGAVTASVQSSWLSVEQEVGLCHGQPSHENHRVNSEF